MLAIRHATLKDLSLIVNLWTEFMLDHDRIISKNPRLKPYNTRLKIAPLKYRKHVFEKLRSKRGTVLIAEVDGAVAGYSLVYIKANVPVFTLKKLGYFSDLYVRKQYRQLGIASRLRDEALAWFRKRGITHISIMLYPDNHFAHSLYRKWGFMDYHLEMRRKL